MLHPARLSLDANSSVVHYRRGVGIKPRIPLKRADVKPAIGKDPAHQGKTLQQVGDVRVNAIVVAETT